MTGWLIALGILLFLAILPVGVSLIYNQSGLYLSILVGLVKIRLLPKPSKEKEKKVKKAKPAKKTEKPQKPVASSKPPKTKEKSGGKLTDFLPLLDIGLKFLGSFRRKLRVNRLYLNLVMAGGDPCDLAVNYGKAWAAVGNLMPMLEKVFVIKKRNVQVQCDFVAPATTIHARLDITITIGRVVGIAVKYGILAVVELLKILNKRKKLKGGTEV